MRYEYNKLVRDKIPENINNKPGKRATYRTMDNDEYIKELNKKVLEEANEFIEVNDPEELADMMEIIETIMKIKNITWQEVKELQEIKKKQKGSFENKIFLEYVDED